MSPQGQIKAQIHGGVQLFHGPAAGPGQEFAQDGKARCALRSFPGLRRLCCLFLRPLLSFPLFFFLSPCSGRSVPFRRAQACHLHDAAEIQMAQGMEPGQGLANLFAFMTPCCRGQAEGRGFYALHHAAQCVRGPHFQKMTNAIPVPEPLHAFHPAHGIFIEIHDGAADIRLPRGIFLRGDAAQHGKGGLSHLQGHEAPVVQLAQDAHARMVKGQRYVENDGSNAFLAQIPAGLHQHVPGPGQDALLVGIVIGDVEIGPQFLQFADHIHAGIDSHHAGFAAGLGLYVRHVPRTRFQNVPAHLRRVDTGQAEGYELAKTVPADKVRPEPPGKIEAPLGVFYQKKVGLLPAGQAYGLHIGLVHQGQHVPVRAGGQAIHGSSGFGEMIIEFPTHAGPHRSLSAAHDGQSGHVPVHGFKPDAPARQLVQSLPVGIGGHGQHLHIPRCDRAKTPALSALYKAFVPDTVQRRRQGHTFLCCRTNFFFHKPKSPMCMPAAPARPRSPGQKLKKAVPAG